MAREAEPGKLDELRQRFPHFVITCLTSIGRWYALPLWTGNARLYLEAESPTELAALMTETERQWRAQDRGE